MSSANESKLIDAIRAGYEEALPGRVKFTKQYLPGQPDFYVEVWKDREHSRLIMDFQVEFKVRPHRPSALIQEWNLLSGLQKLTMIRKAADGKDVFLTVGHMDVQEAPWYYLHPAQAKKVQRNEAAPESMLAMMMMSQPWKPGKWSTGSDWGEPDEGPTMSWKYKALMNQMMKRNGLVKPKGLILPK